jgi:hypothetical protein
VRRLFQDRLPILSALLTETSGEDLEEFYASIVAALTELSERYVEVEEAIVA